MLNLLRKLVRFNIFKRSIHVDCMLLIGRNYAGAGPLAAWPLIWLSRSEVNVQSFPHWKEFGVGADSMTSCAFGQLDRLAVAVQLRHFPDIDADLGILTRKSSVCLPPIFLAR
jgi:hypothetical protein